MQNMYECIHIYIYIYIHIYGCAAGAVDEGVAKAKTPQQQSRRGVSAFVWFVVASLQPVMCAP